MNLTVFQILNNILTAVLWSWEILQKKKHTHDIVIKGF